MYSLRMYLVQAYMCIYACTFASEYTWVPGSVAPASIVALAVIIGGRGGGGEVIVGDI